MDRYSIVIKPILISWRFVVNIKSRAVFSAVSNASVQRNLVGGVRRCWFILPCDWFRKLAPSSRQIGCKTEISHGFATRVFSALQTVHKCLLRFLISFVAFTFFSIRSGNFFVITQSKSDHKKDPLNTSHC